MSILLPCRNVNIDTGEYILPPCRVKLTSLNDLCMQAINHFLFFSSKTKQLQQGLPEEGLGIASIIVRLVHGAIGTCAACLVRCIFKGGVGGLSRSEGVGHRNNNARTRAEQSGETTDARSIQNEMSKERRDGERGEGEGEGERGEELLVASSRQEQLAKLKQQEQLNSYSRPRSRLISSEGLLKKRLLRISQVARILI